MLAQQPIKLFQTFQTLSHVAKITFSSSCRAQAINPSRHSGRKQTRNNTSGKWMMLIFPISSFGLGVWQWQRKKWKLNLIQELERKTSNNPVSFPDDLNELKNLEYCPLIVRGKFDHSKELYIEPRSIIERTDKTPVDAGSMMSVKKDIGLLVITPFHLTDRGITILVNRGFVPRHQKDPRTRREGQIEKEVELTGLLRHNETRPPLSPKNIPTRNQWFYKDLNEMGSLTGAQPILLDELPESSVPGGPIGGQTRISLRDEHLSYMITWFSLSAITTYMWYMRFVK